MNTTISSIIQTVLSVLEFHQISLRSRTLTAGREFHPAPKTIYFILIYNYITLFLICQYLFLQLLICTLLFRKIYTNNFQSIQFFLKLFNYVLFFFWQEIFFKSSIINTFLIFLTSSVISIIFTFYHQQFYHHILHKFFFLVLHTSLILFLHIFICKIMSI